MATLKNTTINDTGYLQLPSGTTAQRPNSPSAGYMRYNTSLSQTEIYNGVSWTPLSTLRLITSNLILHLDANDISSYPGSGTTWTDLSGQGNNFSVVSTAFQSGTPSYMDFNGSYGIAKNSSDISLSDSTGVTYFVITRVKQSTADWRTLTRSYTSDHHVIIESGANNLGMYDNDGSGFIDSGVDQTSFPNYNTSNWAAFYWRWQSSSPYYTFSWNDTPGTTRGSITNTNARYNRGFGALGGYHNGSTSPSVGSQYWGDIGVFMAYNSYLTDSELLANYNYYKSTYGL